MHPAVKQAIGAIESRHEVEVFDCYLRATFTHTVEDRHDHNAVSFVININPDMTVVGACHCTHPWVRFVVPGFDISARLIWSFEKLGWVWDVKWPTPERIAARRLDAGERAPENVAA